MTQCYVIEKNVESLKLESNIWKIISATCPSWPQLDCDILIKWI